MIKIAICDDEQNIVDKIANVTIEYKKMKNIQFETDTFLSGINLIRKFSNFDLIFLDIDMPELNGIEVAKKLRDSDVISKIVYVTNHAHFTSQALSLHAFGYIVKPFKDSEIFSLLEDFMKFFNAEIQSKCKRMSFKTTQGVVCLNVEDIIYFEYSKPNGVNVVTMDKILHTRSTLQEVLKMVEGYGFVSPHKSFIVNLSCVEIIDGINMLMKNGATIQIAQKRVSSFRSAHNRFLRGD